MKIALNIFMLCLLIGCVQHPSENVIVKNRYNYSTISFLAEDHIRVFADYYNYNGKEAPLILMYHQAGFSRGSVRNIAPQLVDLGFNVLAVDLRSGEQFNNIPNLTHLEAKSQKKPTEFTDSIIDLEASLKYAKHQLKYQNIIYWGSSYSGSLGFYMVSKHPTDFKALIAFSPGEYMKIENKKIADYASLVNVPVLISSGRSEGPIWQTIYDSIKSEKTFFLPKKSEGRHGTLALSNEYNDSSEYWIGINTFLKKLK